MKYIVNTLYLAWPESALFLFSPQALIKLVSFTQNFCSVIQSTQIPKIPVCFYFPFY